MSTSNISFFDTYVLRTPKFPVSFYISLLNDYSANTLFETLENPILKNALRLASPELINELEKYCENPIGYSKEKASNLELSVLKYIARMSARATPFGLFAGCTTGILSDRTEIQLKDDFTAHTQFDMQFWIALVQSISQDKKVREQLIYTPNTSFYSVGDFYRYIEYKIINKKNQLVNKTSLNFEVVKD